jgi:transposase
MTLLPKSIEDYIPQEDPVRAYDAFVEALDFDELGITIDESAGGANPYWPKAMVKLLVYGYSYGIRSSRRLERATHHNLSFIWLMSNLRPDYRTIARFRRDNKEALRNILKQCAQMCIKLGLIEGNTLFIDSTKIRANASLKNTWTEEKCQQYLDTITRNIDTLMNECDRIDQEEEDKESLVKLKEELQSKEALATTMKNIMTELKRTNKKQHNTTDPDCVKTKGGQKTNTYYNAQLTVDEKHGLIVSSEATSQVNDSNQFGRQLNHAKEVLDKAPKNACADSGYFDTDDMEKIAADTTIIVPTQQQVHKENQPHTCKAFPKELFTYDATSDEYVCPAGNRLRRTNRRPFGRSNSATYRASGALCRTCHQYGLCTSSPRGRQIVRLNNEHVKERIEKAYQSPEGRHIYTLRKQKVELPFAHIKHNLGVQHFLLRRREGASAELSLLAVCYNITRMIGLLGKIPFWQAKLQPV